MAVELVTETFEGRVGETFAATPTFSGEPLELELTSCVESSHARPDHPAFSLFFSSPDPERREQQIFTLEHGELGAFDLFLVQVGPQQYEAVIN
jgi:hypothetical protein